MRERRSVNGVTAPSAIATLGELRSSGHVHRSVKAEIRENLIARLAAGEPSLPGIVGFDTTVTPEIERALLAGHDMVLLGERGQGKTRLIRTMVGLLDEWTPVVEGCEINDHPYAPVCNRCLAILATDGELTPVAWRHRNERYGEKLATPDTSVGDLVGDVDPIKVAQGRTLGDPETIHYGLVPRTNRGIVAINELPDLAERIQVALLNVLEERDIQVRGYQLRLPLDVLLVASANPEDYTNRGRIITPLKDRFGAEVRTHYPLELRDELALVAQEAAVLWPGRPEASTTGSARSPHRSCRRTCWRCRRASPAPCATRRRSTSVPACRPGSRSPAWRPSPRRRCAAPRSPASRSPSLGVADLPSVIPASRGKVEFDDADEGREFEVLEHLLRRAVAETYRATAGRARPAAAAGEFDDGLTVETGDTVSAPTSCSTRSAPVPVLSALLERLEPDGIGEGPAAVGIAAAVLEFALEGLYLNKRLAKDSDGARTVYGD